MSFDAKDYRNDDSVEQMWAMQAVDHSETYMNLIASVDSRMLKLSSDDNLIFDKFRKDFPGIEVNVIKPDQLKGPAAKVKWRMFCNNFKGQIKDFNQGTLLRLDCTKDYSEENTILVTRIQFIAIEIGRNRDGLNLPLWKAQRKEEKAGEEVAKVENLITRDDSATENGDCGKS